MFTPRSPLNQNHFAAIGREQAQFGSGLDPPSDRERKHFGSGLEGGETTLDRDPTPLREGTKALWRGAKSAVDRNPTPCREGTEALWIGAKTGQTYFGSGLDPLQKGTRMG